MGKNQSASNLVNIIQYNNGNISFISGSTTLMSISSSGAITTTGVISGSNALSASYAATSTSASYAVNATTASYAVNATTASYATSLTVAGTLTAQTLVVQTITSSVSTITGSTQFGSTGSNTHSFTGSVNITGSLNGMGASFNNDINISNGSISNDSGNKALYVYGSLGSTDSDVAALQLIQMWNGRAYKSVVSAQQDTAGGPASSALVFKTSVFNGTDVTTSEKMRITSDGKVGIGITTPTFGKLSVLGADNSTISSTLWGTSAGAGMVIGVYNTSQTVNSVAGIRLITRDSGASVWNIYNISTGNDSGDLAFGNGAGGTGTEKVRITNGGIVGIGTSNPKSYSTLTVNGQTIGLNNIGVDAGQSFRLNNYYNSATTSDRTISTGYGASIGLNNSVGAMTFNISSVTSSADNNITVSERMRITSGGDVGIGTTSPLSKLHIYGTGANTQTINMQSSIAGANAYIVMKNTSKSYVTGLSYDLSNSYIIYDDNAATSRLTITSDGITQIQNLRTSTIYSEYTKNLSGAYSAGTFYPIVNSSQMASGVYILKAYVDTYAIGGGTYFITYVSVPFFFYTQGANNNGTQIFPTMLGSGHAGYNPPIIRLRLSFGVEGGLTYLEFDPNANWSNVQGTSGATVTFYVKRIGD